MFMTYFKQETHNFRKYQKAIGPDFNAVTVNGTKHNLPVLQLRLCQTGLKYIVEDWILASYGDKMEMI
jgi:hypothetical protein